MTAFKTGGTALKFKQPKYIIATLFNDSEATPAGDCFYLETVVRDTTSVTQDDPETTDIECETSDSPIDSVTKLGKYNFSTEVADSQAKVVQGLMGWSHPEGSDSYYAPAGYTEKYASIAIVFESGKKSDGKTKYAAFIIPRLKLNSKLMLESMNSNILRVNLAGTAMDWTVNSVTTPFYMDSDYDLPE